MKNYLFFHWGCMFRGCVVRKATLDSGCIGNPKILFPDVHINFNERSALGDALEWLTCVSFHVSFSEIQPMEMQKGIPFLMFEDCMFFTSYGSSDLISSFLFHLFLEKILSLIPKVLRCFQTAQRYNTLRTSSLFSPHSPIK